MSQSTQPTGTGLSAGVYTKLADGSYQPLTDATTGLIVSEGISPNLVQTVQVSVSSVDILALNATPKTLVAAPGAGKAIVVDSITLKMVTTSTQYANGGALEFRYTDASGAKVTADVADTVVKAGAGTSYSVVPGVAVTAVANAPIVLDNATAPFITGTGTATVVVNYHVVSV